MSVPLNVGIMLKDKTRYLPRIFWSAALVCTVLSFWWIPRYGMIGAAWATLAGNAILTLGIAWVSSKFYPIAYTWAPVIRIVLVTITGGAGLWLLQRWLVGQTEVLRFVVRLLWVAAVSGALGLHLWRGQRARLRTGSSCA
jgi:O-antigen/teichoic acid export membrane protein